jgi:hypothetical protein
MSRDEKTGDLAASTGNGGLCWGLHYSTRLDLRYL